jgi:hypothetical protein
MRTTLVRAALVFVVIGAVPHTAPAQPLAWVPHGRNFGFSGFEGRLRVVNLASGELLNQIDLGSIVPNAGALSPDGEFYFLATSLGVGKFRTSTRTLVGMFGPSVHARLVEVSPSGQWVHVVTDTARYLTLAASTGAVVADRCCDAPARIVFSPDGSRRFELRRENNPVRTVITAYPDTPTAAPLWQRTSDGLAYHLAAGSQDLVHEIYVDANSTDVVILDAATGEERGRVSTASVYGLAVHSDVLLVSASGPPLEPYGRGRWQLLRLELSTLTTSFLRDDLPGSPSWVSTPGRVAFSSDGAVAYWLDFISVLGVTVSSTGYRAIDTSTGDVLASGVLNGQYSADFDVEPGTPCIFDAPGSAAVPPEGGLVDIPVLAHGPCLPWSVPVTPVPSVRVINPGPHSGGVTLRVAVQPTLWATSVTNRITVPGRSFSIEQTGALPATPGAIAASVANRRVTLSWTPSIGAAHNSFFIRGGIIGGSTAHLATLGVDPRVWTSEALPPGSYVLQVAAGNYGGVGAYSDPIPFSIGVQTVPQAPLNVQTTSADGVVEIRWAPPASGATPSWYDIEAAPAGSSAFLTVARVVMPMVSATHVAAGLWDVRVRAVTDGGRSAPSNAVTITAASCTSPPSAPAGLVSAGTTTLSAMARLHWNAPASGGAEDYVIEVGSASGASDLGRIVSTGPGLVFESTAPSGVFFARVRARNACGESAPSNDAVVLVP